MQKKDTLAFISRLFTIKIKQMYYQTQNNILCQNMNANFEMGTIYILKNVLTMLFQIVTPTCHTLFEFLGSNQPEKFLIFALFFKSSRVRWITI